MSLITRSTTILFVLLALSLHTVFAHTYLSAVYLDNSLLDQGDCVRPHPNAAFDSPIPLVTSADMTCGWLPSASTPANRKCPIAAGSSIGIQWHHNSNSDGDDIIDSTHKGPIMFYLAKSDSGAGNVWFKIYEDGLVNGVWAVDRLIANRGRVDITIPSDIAPGNYLLRGELIALHGAYALNGAQPYVGCVELTISGSGSANPAGVAFPGYYTNTDAGIFLSIYQGITNYIIPGPAVYKAGSSSSGSSTSAPTTKPTNAPTTKPTNAPTVAPTQSATKAPTTAPTTTPSTAPTTRPTNPNNGNVKTQVNTGTSDWWFAIAVSGGSEDTVKLEVKDSGRVSAFTITVKAKYGFYFSQSVQLTLPLTLRLTSASGKQVVLENYITSFSDFGLKDSGKDYSTSVTPAPATQAPTKAPTAAPTQAATQAPTTKPTTAPTQAATQAPTTKPTVPPTTTCTDGHMKCTGASTYSSCARGVWQSDQSCQVGLSCLASEPYIYCV
jgi:cellulase